MDIPNDFITKRIPLRGTITSINKSGYIFLRNQPILSIRKQDGMLYKNYAILKPFQDFMRNFCDFMTSQTLNY